MVPHFNHHGNSTMPINGASNVPNNNTLFPNNDQMAAMMNMFNPMMAAFIQQLASQSNIVPQNNQGGIDPHNSNAAVIAALGHHPNNVPTGVPPPPWTSANAPMQANPMNQSIGLNQNGINSNYSLRYKEKHF